MATEVQTKIVNTNLLSFSSSLYDQDRIYGGLSLVWNNPNIYNPGTTGNYLNAVVPANLRYQKYQSTVLTKLVTEADNFIRANHIKKVATDATTVGNKVSTLTSKAIDVTTVPTWVVAGDAVKASDFNAIETVVNKINTVLSGYNSYWDSGNLCQRSCQLNCQVGCQVACQSCVTSQCHDQWCS